MSSASKYTRADLDEIARQEVMRRAAALTAEYRRRVQAERERIVGALLSEVPRPSRREGAGRSGGVRGRPTPAASPRPVTVELSGATDSPDLLGEAAGGVVAGPALAPMPAPESDVTVLPSVASARPSASPGDAYVHHMVAALKAAAAELQSVDQSERLAALVRECDAVASVSDPLAAADRVEVVRGVLVAELLASVKARTKTADLTTHDETVLERLAKAADGLWSAPATDQFAARSTTVVRELRALDERAAERETARQTHLYLVESLRRAIVRMGYEVTDFAVADGVAEFEGARPSGQSIVVHVQRDGEIRYEVDGFPMRFKSSGNGVPTATCDEALAQLEAIHDEMSAESGVAARVLYWDGMGPRLRSVQADDLPRAERRDRSLGGGAR